MSGVWGNKIKYSIFGESHGSAIGITIDGLPPGLKLDLQYIQDEMERRAPGRNNISTTRKETDSFEILSGYFNEHTTGTPLCALIRNSDKHSKDYSRLKDVMRPGHADYTGNIKYSGFNDYRGGGHFSGRLTAPLVFAGSVAKQVLKGKDIIVGSHIYSIGNIYDNPFDMTKIESKTLSNLLKKRFPVLDEEKASQMQDLILKAKEELDSVGGIIEAAVLNLPAGIGDPFFDSLESTLAHLLFSIPAVKGVEFGSGFSISEMRGYEANDEFYIDGNKVKTVTNNNGGILGGITSGMPVVFRVAFKPTPSISKRQKTIDISKGENTELEIVGRHDPCIVQRAVPVVEAAAAMAVLELFNTKI